VALGAVLVFAAIGGTRLAGGLAKGKAQYAPGQYTFSEKKVTVCHKRAGDDPHLRQRIARPPQPRDSMGLCPALAAAKAKAAKAAGERRSVGRPTRPRRPGTAREWQGERKREGKRQRQR
jgi:hypothetical protein